MLGKRPFLTAAASSWNHKHALLNDGATSWFSGTRSGPVACDVWGRASALAFS